MIFIKTHKELETYLMDSKAVGIKESYFIIESENQCIYVINPGLNGIEFNKTEGYFREDDSVGIYQCLYGQGILIMQRNDEFGEAKEFKVVTLLSGRQAVIPAGFGHSLINIGKGLLVVLDNSTHKPKTEYKEPLEQKRGFVYYIVEKKGEIAFEENPNYSVHPQISSE
ncbi:hypothetical protein A3F00_03700 [Candidatus Daviesbacteria bacterium RIFCSPHIGHO2_12_FULL_37_11]|uniref:glucose-6-phosphate isomerase n=1 Tax=Candidatus Daviesbacteria bacterium RIFCSPHIGHO2_12_FULL_37_11 TaxID=1797777 RepID=A0A1F5KCN2_9BACT|nr:MAG: hypothetical protein A2111_03010 [Candidatus Daviesbacteria bacterium GWA1_38_6]OGE16385.1 MAG: hypothetical protein A2769_00350 [Candidatus Daviesbacteria bacterium RIFCSPHIGHO2_01_FULL_37_27]OGE38648.1 MAG: hypothetical protein A3F00_03700 [Candidatus Daviesbacteria bacterium RIFCSPHIGHO2_12_FULL_37_11]OGE45972.1 MAG: hypothetical protein A3B39_02970 [Candidatus Daviesbacteria bacterium RIFCSPLOWO2_01_FULL_37_10]